MKRNVLFSLRQTLWSHFDKNLRLTLILENEKKSLIFTLPDALDTFCQESQILSQMMWLHIVKDFILKLIQCCSYVLI